MRPVNQRQMTLACIRLADGHSVQVENEADAYAVIASTPCRMGCKQSTKES